MYLPIIFLYNLPREKYLNKISVPLKLFDFKMKIAHLYIDYDNQPINEKTLALHQNVHQEVESHGVKIEKMFVFVNPTQKQQFESVSSSFSNASIIEIGENNGKNAMDIAITCDVMKKLYSKDKRPDIIIIGSTDSDFKSLVDEIKQKEIECWGIVANEKVDQSFYEKRFVLYGTPEKEYHERLYTVLKSLSGQEKPSVDIIQMMESRGYNYKKMINKNKTFSKVLKKFKRDNPTMKFTSKNGIHTFE
jgi:uncharacterized LabA/DUF88 family protein